MRYSSSVLRRTSLPSFAREAVVWSWSTEMPDGVPSPPPFLFAREVLAGGGSTAIVSAVLNPVDVIKTRRQLFAYRDMRAIEIGQQLYAEGGLGALWRPGMTATVTREMLYSGCTKGLYPIVRDAIAGDAAEPSLPQRVAAASGTGFLGSICANAVDVVKIRQFERPDRYGGSLINALSAIAREEGLVSGLLVRGCSASAPRGAAIAVGEVTTYDQVKTWLKRHYEDGFAVHVVTSLITGVVATPVAAPFDLLKSRVMASDLATDSFATVLARLLRQEGPFALFNGWLPTYLRCVGARRVQVAFGHRVGGSGRPHVRSVHGATGSGPMRSSRSRCSRLCERWRVSTICRECCPQLSRISTRSVDREPRRGGLWHRWSGSHNTRSCVKEWRNRMARF